MEVVVPCDCGSRFCFEVEPVNGRLPAGAELLCPSCNKDGIPLANRVIADNLRKVAQQVEGSLESQILKKPRLGRSKKVPKTQEPESFEHAHRDPFAQARRSGMEEAYSGPNKLRGMIGAVLGGAVGAATWAGVVYLTGYEIRYVAVAVGALVGLATRTIGGGRDYHLGLFATACALVAILVGQYFAADAYIKAASVEIAAVQYEARLEEAKEVTDLKSDADIKAFLAASQSTVFKPVSAASITDKAVAEFKTTELPTLKKLAAGEPPKEAFIEQERRAFLEKLTVKDIFTASITPYLFLWVFLGIGAAWKLASDYGTSVE
jgi:hypothetical protein